MWPVIILGVLMFIPGAYHMRVAILAYQKVPGYSFDDIPEFDWIYICARGTYLLIQFNLNWIWNSLFYAAYIVKLLKEIVFQS